MPETEVTEEAILGFNRPNVREAGVRGGGGIMSAGDLALFYQGLLHNRGTNGAPIIKPEALKDALRVGSSDYKDRIFGYKVNRALGVVVAGDDGLANYRGFGKTNSPSRSDTAAPAGKTGWPNPTPGIPSGYSTNEFVQNAIPQAPPEAGTSSPPPDSPGKG